MEKKTVIKTECIGLQNIFDLYSVEYSKRDKISYVQTDCTMTWVYLNILFLFLFQTLLIFYVLRSGSAALFIHLPQGVTSEAFYESRDKKRAFYIVIHRCFSRCQIFGYLYEIFRKKNLSVYECYWVLLAWKFPSSCLFWIRVSFPPATGRLQLLVFRRAHILWLSVQNRDNPD